MEMLWSSFVVFFEGLDVFISLTIVTISQCIHISHHRVAHFKYVQKKKENWPMSQKQLYPRSSMSLGFTLLPVFGSPRPAPGGGWESACANGPLAVVNMHQAPWLCSVSGYHPLHFFSPHLVHMVTMYTHCCDLNVCTTPCKLICWTPRPRHVIDLVLGPVGGWSPYEWDYALKESPRSPPLPLSPCEDQGEVSSLPSGNGLSPEANLLAPWPWASRDSFCNYGCPHRCDGWFCEST